MHMADALISPAVGGTMWIVTAGLIAYCARKLKQTMKDNIVPMMGVMGAFIFAAQMINFSIPGTGSSGHLGGALILSILLGPYAAFLVIASVLTVQAFFFADGGLLALGCNIFNLGFYPAFIAYPFIYRLISRDEPWSPLLFGQAVAPPLAGEPAVVPRRLALGTKAGKHGTPRAWIAAIVTAIVGLQLGAFSVVLETRASGISELPFGAFVLLILPIHLAIGIVEGLATAAVVSFIASARPELVMGHPLREDMSAGPVARHCVARLPHTSPRRSLWRSLGVRHYNKAYPSPVTGAWPVLAGLLIAAVIVGGAASWFASTHPDGLEWSIAKVTGKEEVSGSEDKLHKNLAQLQEKTSFLPDYDFKSTEAETAPEKSIEKALDKRMGHPERSEAESRDLKNGISSDNEILRFAQNDKRSSLTASKKNESSEPKWPAVTAGTSVSGIVGGLLTLALACLVGFALKARRATMQPNSKHEIRNPTCPA